MQKTLFVQINVKRYKTRCTPYVDRLIYTIVRNNDANKTIFLVSESFIVIYNKSKDVQTQTRQPLPTLHEYRCEINQHDYKGIGRIGKHDVC